MPAAGMSARFVAKVTNVSTSNLDSELNAQYIQLVSQWQTCYHVSLGLPFHATSGLSETSHTVDDTISLHNQRLSANHRREGHMYARRPHQGINLNPVSGQEFTSDGH